MIQSGESLKQDCSAYFQSDMFATDIQINISIYKWIQKFIIPDLQNEPPQLMRKQMFSAD